MRLQLFFHPFSSYSQKALIALYENDTPFKSRVLSPKDPATGAEFARAGRGTTGQAVFPAGRARQALRRCGTTWRNTRFVPPSAQ